MMLERVTFRVENDDLESVEELVDAGEYPNRSEALRHAVKLLLSEHEDPQSVSEENAGKRLMADGGDCQR